DGLTPDQEVAGGNEVRDRLGEERLRAESAARVDREPGRVAPHLRVEADVVHRRLRAVVRAALERDLEYARQRQVQRIEEEVLVDREAIRRHVERLVGRRPG